jgi:CheY-like chemotaxis protein
LMPLLRDVIETMRPAAEAKEIRIEHVMDPFAGPLKGDPARLQQVFWNLLSNAVKFTPKGGKLQVCLERIDSHVEVSVSDTGQGIVPEFLPHVFDRFRQADSSTTRRYAGLGLGLAIVKHLVELHGGQVEAKSPGEGKGATFIVRLPIAIVQEIVPGRAHFLGNERGSNEPWDDVKLTNIRVLVVDDDADTCETLQRLLRECGASVNTAASGQEALQRLNAGTYDIVVSDIGMPEMDGYEFIRQVRAQGVTIPAVAATAFARSEDRIRVLQAGYNMHLAKPLESRELITVIAALVRTGLSSERG